MKVKLFTDGGARGNPGPAAIGGVIYNDEDEVIDEVSEYIGETTNNQAEYRALLATLGRAKQLGATHVQCYLDSELVVKQINHEWKVKDADLAPLVIQIHNASIGFKKVTFSHIPREQNVEADRLVNLALDTSSELRTP